MDNVFTIHVRKRTIKIALAVAIVMAVLTPVAVVAAGGTFTDDDTSVFEADIEWMASTGITFGCNPPANDNYCPDRAVTRGQMAAFMHRLAENQVVDADMVDGLHASGLSTVGHVHTGGDIVNGSVTGTDIAGNTVSNVNTSDEPGVVSNYRTTAVIATSTPTAMVSTSIRVPSDGWVIVEVTGNWRGVSAGQDGATCQLQKGGVGAIDLGQPFFYLDDRDTGASHLSAFSAHRVLEIAAADNPFIVQNGQTLHLVCDEYIGDIRLSELHIAATFYATSYAPPPITIP